jgi:hypothetical protein
VDAPTPRLVGLEVDDDPAAWRRAGFAVADDRFAVGGVTVRLLGGGHGRGVRSASFDPPVADEVDGLRLTVPESSDGDGHPPGPGEATHANGVTAIDHVVVTSDDVERTTAALATCGLSPRRTVVGARGDGDDEIVYRFFLLGTCVLELVGPTRGGGNGPARFAGLAFTTERIDELGALAGTPRDAVQPGRRIATLRGEDLGVSVPTAFLTPRPRRDR